MAQGPSVRCLALFLTGLSRGHVQAAQDGSKRGPWGTASGIRNYVAARLRERLGAAAMRPVTIGLLGAGVILPGLVLKDSS
jgi:hypothetical protein